MQITFRDNNGINIIPHNNTTRKPLFDKNTRVGGGAQTSTLGSETLSSEAAPSSLLVMKFSLICVLEA